MGLSDRRRSQWLVLKLSIDLVDSFAGLLFDDGFCHGRVQRLYVFTQFFELLAVHRGQQINSAGHDLPHLHIGGPKILQRRPKFLRCKAVGVKIMPGKDGDHFGGAVLLSLMKHFDFAFEKSFQLRAHFLCAAFALFFFILKLIHQFLLLIIQRHLPHAPSRF